MASIASFLGGIVLSGIAQNRHFARQREAPRRTHRGDAAGHAVCNVVSEEVMKFRVNRVPTGEKKTAKLTRFPDDPSVIAYSDFFRIVVSIKYLSSGEVLCLISSDRGELASLYVAVWLLWH